MNMPVGQLVLLSIKEILKRILNGPDPTISETEIANVVRQNVIGKATTIIVASGGASAEGSGGASAEDRDTIMLITHRCIDLLSHMNDLEVTFSLGTDGTRSVSIRKTGNITVEELIRSAEKMGSWNAQPATLSLSSDWVDDQHQHGRIEGKQENNADILARIRERVNRPEEGDY